MTAPTLARTSSSGGRHYQTPIPQTAATRNTRFPNITGIIGGGIPKNLDSWYSGEAARYAYTQLPEWLNQATRSRPAWVKDDQGAAEHAIKRIAGAANRARDAAGDAGTAAHTYFEARARGEQPCDMTRLMAGGFVAAIDRFFDMYAPVILHVEATVFSEAHGYAGTVDFIAYIPGYGVVIGDLKTSQSGAWPEVGLQLAAGRYAEYICAPAPGVDHSQLDVEDPAHWVQVPLTSLNIVGGVVVHCRPDDPQPAVEHEALTVTVGNTMPGHASSVDRRTAYETADRATRLSGRMRPGSVRHVYCSGGHEPVEQRRAETSHHRCR